MYKPVHNAVGCITQAISAVAGVIPLDPNSHGALVAVLGTAGTDHTYLRIGTPPLSEVVRVDVVNMDGTVDVTRGQDYTTGRSFAGGTLTQWVSTAAAVADIVDETVSPNNVEVVAGANVQVVEDPAGTFTVSATPMELSSSDGTINVSGSYPDISIDIERGAFGCCD